MTEKPMSISLEDAQGMISAAEENGVVLGVIFQNRYNPGSQLVKAMLESGQLGRIISSKLSVTWKRTDAYYAKSDWKGTWDKEGGGVIIDQGIHTLDLVRWLVDSEIEFVAASISNRTHTLIDVEDAAEGVIKYKNGVLTSFYAINYYGYDAPIEIELHCERGLARISADTGTVILNNGREFKAAPDPNEFIDYGNVKHYWGVSHIKQITNFYQALAQGIDPEITGKDAVKTQALVCAIYESGKKKQKIYLL